MFLVTTHAMDPTATPTEFMFLFRNTALEERLTPEEMPEAMTKLNVWLERWSKSGHIKGGQPLAYARKTISGTKDRVIVDGPFPEAKEVIGGYVLVQAADFDEATAIAAEWPLLAYDAIVEVRPVLVQCPGMMEAGMELYPVGNEAPV